MYHSQNGKVTLQQRQLEQCTGVIINGLTISRNLPNSTAAAMLVLAIAIIQQVLIVL